MQTSRKILLKLVQPDISDIGFMSQLLVHGAQQGHFSPRILETPGFINNTLVSLLQYGRLFDKPLRAQTIIFEHNKKRIGFAVIAEVETNQGGNELYAMAVDEQLRGQGYGRAMLDEILKRWSSVTLYARCFPSSQQMYDMLIKSGFVFLFDRKDGARVLARSAVNLSVPA